MGITSTGHPALTTTSRRRALQLTGGSLAALALSACRTEPREPVESPTTTTRESSINPPTFVKYEGVTPDLPGDGQHVPDGFLTYPSQPVQAVASPPGDGSTVTVTCQAFGQIPPPMAQNTYWQELNKRLGVTLDILSTPSAEYDSKVATQLAGGTMTDIVQIPTWSMKRLPELLTAKFADLTEYLAGDAVTEYPFLANNPPHIWPASTYDGRIMGIRRSLFTYGHFMLTNRGIVNELGLSADSVTDAESFAEMCAAVTDGSANRWALMNPVNTVKFVAEMLGHPATWHHSGGSFTHGREDERYRQALAFVKERLWDKGCYHPDALSLSGSEEIKQFTAGRAVMDYRGGNQWANLVRVNQIDLAAIAPVSFDGDGLGVKELGDGVYSLTAFNAELSPDRLRMLLEVANWLSAPFGTDEFQFRTYGLEGTHHTRKADGDIQTEPKGSQEIQLPVSYIASSPSTIYIAGHPDATTENHEFIARVAPTGLQSAAAGLWSATADAKNAELEASLIDTVTGIFRGQYNLDDYDRALDEWRSNGGDAIRAEYEEAFANSQVG